MAHFLLNNLVAEGTIIIKLKATEHILVILDRFAASAYLLNYYFA